ncbi:MAG: hypothetical protein R2706_18015 [Acidimicrobiales bacterium]
MAVSAVSRTTTTAESGTTVTTSITLLLGFGAVLYASVVELVQTVLIERSDRPSLRPKLNWP